MRLDQFIKVMKPNNRLEGTKREKVGRKSKKTGNREEGKKGYRMARREGKKGESITRKINNSINKMRWQRIGRMRKIRRKRRHEWE